MNRDIILLSQSAQKSRKYNVVKDAVEGDHGLYQQNFAIGTNNDEHLYNFTPLGWCGLDKTIRQYYSINMQRQETETRWLSVMVLRQ